MRTYQFTHDFSFNIQSNYNMDKEIIIRKAERSDCKSLRKLIQKLADFERMPDGPKLDAEAMERDGFGEHPLFHCFVAEIQDQLIGYAIYYYTYSTWSGKSMFMDELFVLPEFRNKGIGSKLFNAVAKKAADVNCARLDFVVLDWNPAGDFYKRKGVIDITETEKWHQYRIDGDALKKFSENTNDI